MKRSSLIALGVVLAVTLAMPAAPAAAHGSGKHHAKKRGHAKKGHKARHHVVFRKRAHHRLTVADAGDPKVADRIGTIVSFADGVLTIKLDGGKTIEGAVTDATEIECDGPLPAPAPTGTTTARSSHSDDDDDDGDREHDGDDDDDEREHRSFGDHDDGDDDGPCDRGDDRPCTTADLVAGTVVSKVELKVTADGLVFREIELAK